MSIQGMTGTVEEGDYQGLVGVMARLLSVKDKRTTADTMFEPLMQTVELLKTYQQEISDSVYVQLQVKYFLLMMLTALRLCIYTLLLQNCVHYEKWSARFH